MVEVMKGNGNGSGKELAIHRHVPTVCVLVGIGQWTVDNDKHTEKETLELGKLQLLVINAAIVCVHSFAFVLVTLQSHVLVGKHLVSVWF